MATADQYAEWIVANEGRKGTPEFDTVAAAYKEAKNEGATYSGEKGSESMFAELAAKRAKEYNPNTRTGEYALERIKRGVVGGTLGLTGLLADVAQLPARGLSALGVKNIRGEPLVKLDEPYFGATEQAIKMGDKLLSNDRAMLPASVAQKYMGNVAEFVGASLLPSGVVIKASPHKYLAGAAEAGSTIGGGVAAQFSGDLAQSAGVNRAWGELPGGILGGIAGKTLPTLASKAKGGADVLAASQNSRPGKQLAGVVKAEGANDAIDQSFKNAADIEAVTGRQFNPTLAGRTKSQTIIDIEKGALGRNVESTEMAIANQNANVANLQAFSSAVFPESKTWLKSSAFSANKAALDSIDDAAARIAAQRAVIGSGVAGKESQIVGQGLSDIRASAKDVAKGKLTGEIDQIYGIAKNVNEPMDDVAGLVKKIAGEDINTYQKMPPVFSEIHKNYIKPPIQKPAGLVLGADGNPVIPSSIVQQKPKASFEEIHSLYKETNRQLSEAVGAKDGTMAMYLGQLKGSLKQKLNKFEGAEYGDLGSRFKQWNADYSDYAKTFKEGTSGRMEAANRYGKLLTKESIVRKFLTPTGMDEFSNLYKSDPTAVKLFEDGVLDLFAKQSGVKATGEINPKLAATFMKNHGSALSKMPELRDKLSSASSSTEALIERSARLIDAKDQISGSIVAKLAKSEDSFPIIQKALTDRREMMRLMQTGDEGRKAVAHVMAKAIPDAAKKAGMTVTEYMTAHADSISPALGHIGKNHFKNMKTIAEGLDTLAAGAPPTHPALTKFNTDPIEAFTGQTGASIVSQYRATQITRQSSPVHMASTGIAKYWMKLSGEEAKRMQEYLLTNADAAKDFAASAKGVETSYSANSLRRHFLAAGVRVTGATTDSLGKEKENK